MSECQSYARSRRRRALFQAIENLEGRQLLAAGPVIKFSQASYSFTDVVGGEASAQLLVLRNAGTTELSVPTMTLGGKNAGDFALSGKIAPLTIPPGKTRTARIEFNAKALGSRTATLTITS